MKQKLKNIARKLCSIKKICSYNTILVSAIFVSGCSLHPPQAKNLPPILQKNILYINQRENSSFDSQIKDFFQSMGINIINDSNSAPSEIDILKLESSSSLPSLSDSSETTSITYTYTVTYRVTNLHTGKKLGPLLATSSSSTLVNQGQLYSSANKTSIEQRLQYNCIIQIFNQLSSKNSWLQLKNR